MTAEIPVRSSGPAVIAGPCSALRSNAMEVAMAGLTAADPGEATRRTVSYDLETDTVWIGGRAYPLASTSSIWVVGAGKATYRVGEALESVLGDRLAGGVVAVRDPDLAPLDHIKVLRSDHPLPSERSGQAANDILSIARSATKGDLVLACFTGGSSALASLPPAGVSPTDKRALHEVLLSSGLAITDINVVRKAVSDVKGGRVALAAAPATLVNLTVSDVAGSPLDTVTDPTVQDTGTAAQARAVLSDAGLWEQIPASVYVYLEANHPTPRLGDEPQTVVLADGASTVAVMESAAHGLGYRTVVAQEVEGDADVVGPMLAGQLLAELDREPGTQ